METVKYFFLSHKPQCIFFLVFMAACVPVLYYYQRRNPNPRFRPTFGEMSMVTLFAMCLCGGLSFGLGSVFNEHQDFKKLAGKASADYVPTGAGGTAGKRAESDDNKKTDNSAAIMSVLGSGKE